MQPTFDRTPEVGVHPSFGDQAPFLLTTEESLAAVNKWTRPAGRVVTQKCFRPNIVLRNAVGGAWKEDFWRRIRIGPEARGADGGRTLRDAHKAGELSSEFWVAKAAPRCILTTVIPEEGRFHPSGEPLLSLRSHRKVLPHIPSQSDGAFFGQLLMPLKSTGSVRVGDRVTVTAAREKMFDPVREKVQEQDKQAVEEQDRKEEEGGNKKQSKQNKAKKDE
jgi:uncharacterized protein YcbX